MFPFFIPGPLLQQNHESILSFEDDKQCSNSYQPDKDKDYLPTYISRLKLSRLSRRPATQSHQ